MKTKNKRVSDISVFDEGGLDPTSDRRADWPGPAQSIASSTWPAFRLLSGPFIRNPKSPGSQRGSSHFSKGTKARKDSHARHDRVEVFWQTFGRLRLRLIQSVQC